MEALRRFLPPAFRPPVNSVGVLEQDEVYDDETIIEPDIIVPQIELLPPQPEVSARLIAHCGADYMTREQLRNLPVPESTRTFKPIPHIDIVDALVETLGFRGLQVQREEYAATPDGAKCFGVMELNHELLGVRFALGFRNSSDKSLKLGLTVGYRTFICDNLAFNGDYTPLSKKHSNSLNLIDQISIGVDRIQRYFKPLEQTLKRWQETELTDNTAKLLLYAAFVEKRLPLSSRLLPEAHEHYFNPQYEDFKARTLWSFSNALTSAIKKLDPIKQQPAAAKVGAFLAQAFGQ